MSGSGHNHSFNTILHNNRLLLKRRSIFQKGHSFRGYRQEYLKAGSGKVDFRKATKEELLELRRKVIRERRIRAIRSWSIAILISIPIIFLGVELSTYFSNRAVKEVQESEYQDLLLINQRENELKERNLNEYDFLLKDGDNWIQKGNLTNAIHQFEGAVNLFPSKYDANYKLASVYLLICESEKKGCEKGTEIVRKLLTLFPNDNATLELKEGFEIITVANTRYHQ